MVFSAFLKSSIQLLKQDPVLFVPYLFLFLVTRVLLMSFSSGVGTMDVSGLIFIFFVWWLLDLFVKGITIVMTVSLCQKQEVSMTGVSSVVFSRFSALFLANAVIFFGAVLFFGVFVTLLMPLLKVVLNTSLVGFLMLFMAYLVHFFLCFVAFFVLNERDVWLVSVKHTIHFVKRYFRPVVQFSVLMLTVQLFGLSFALLMSKVPVIGDAVLSLLIQSVVSTILCVFVTVFVLDRKAKPMSVDADLNEH